MNPIGYKRGRRMADDPRPPLKSITFKVDEETLRALEQLERRLVGADVRGKTSVVLRKLILDAVRK